MALIRILNSGDGEEFGFKVQFLRNQQRLLLGWHGVGSGRGDQELSVNQCDWSLRKS